MKMLHLKRIESAIPKLINIELPIKIAYKLNIIMDDIEKHLVKLQEFRVAFLNQHGEKDEKGIKIKKTKLKEFDDGMEELLQEDIDIQPVEVALSLIIDQPITFTVLEIESLKNAGFLIDDINKNED